MKESDIIPDVNYNVDNEAIEAIVSGKNILVTGAGGSIGSHLVKKIASFSPSAIILVDIAETPLHTISLYLKEHNITHSAYLADIRNTNRLTYIFETAQPAIVIHVAAYKHVWLTEENPAEAISVNAIGTKNVVDLSIEKNCEKCMLISTDKAVSPVSVLGATKQLAEQYVLERHKHAKNTSLSIVRFGNVFNSNGSVIEKFTNQLLHQKPVTLTHKEVERYFLTISNACNLILQCLCFSEDEVLYTFNMGAPLKIESILQKLITQLGVTPVSIIETGLQSGEKLKEALHERNAEVKTTSHDKIIALNEFKLTHNIHQIYEQLEDLITHIHSPQKIKEALMNALTEYQPLS
ncbi:polysaccharide biosynthesis protein [Neptunitalea lumnitzerae]|uniref:Polysaccharide biosynthesis protein CapD-like domain-containing protein n=1 Tax=Neptunitalea lumnitzerae TaxID=2965509 RepID=A0ABQ5MFE7_9FLAO|nr:polysaccharide biosynthesis protein [Neptunitalea sp. Y10]GLB48130.1 hypothetical protein Y10_04980 [Neptunitalea sp. Y10]